jgi:ATP-binding cassette subfamily B protein/ATP-binding cassette subfamily C protein
MLKSFENNITVLFHYIRIAYNIDKLYVPFLFLSSVIKAFIPFINIVMSKYIIDELLMEQRTDIIIWLVLITITSNCILILISSVLNYVIEIKNRRVIIGFELHLSQKIMNMDFENIEDPEILNLKEKAIYPVKNQGILQNMINNIISSVQNIVTILSLILLISTLNIYILLFLILFVFINVRISMKSQKAELEFITEIIKDNREMGYYRGLTQDFSMGKDIRLYHMKSLILSKIREYIEKSTILFKRLMSKTSVWGGISNIIMQLQMSIIYGYIAYKVLNNNITTGSFTMYITASISFCTALSSFLQNIVQFKQICKFLHPYKEFEDICSEAVPQNSNHLILQDEFCIEFKNVFFKYPRSEENILNNVCIKIKSGEKLSIVGMNGAGKTTFVKLLCRLYRPTMGEITLNGVDVNTFDFQQYTQYINAIFQDFKLFAFSIGENITMDDQWNEKNIFNVLSEVGLREKINKMENSINTPLYRSFDEKGVELSGGEYQKLAIARALYRDSKIIILDEPTAALDPIAENEIFINLNNFAKNKTTIYISHRLSSCKYCDHIALFDNGCIIQYGSHDDLITNKEGKYYELFTTQAKYYGEKN